MTHITVPTLREVDAALAVAKEAGDVSLVNQMTETREALTCQARIERLEDNRDPNRTVTVAFREIEGGVRVAWSSNRLGRKTKAVVHGKIKTTYDDADTYRKKVGIRLARIRLQHGPYVFISHPESESMQAAVLRSMRYERDKWEKVPQVVRRNLRWYCEQDVAAVPVRTTDAHVNDRMAQANFLLDQATVLHKDSTRMFHVSSTFLFVSAMIGLAIAISHC